MRIKVRNCSFIKNEGSQGSAINWSGSALIISDSNFEENNNILTTTNSGGAVYFNYNLDTKNAQATIGEFSCTN